jgi:hypothetical protein
VTDRKDNIVNIAYIHVSPATRKQYLLLSTFKFQKYMETVDVGDMVKVTCSLGYNERQHILSLEAQSMKEISSANLVIE